MNKSLLFCVARWAAAALAVVLLVTMLSFDPLSDTPPEEMEQAVTSVLELSMMQKADNQMIRRLYGLNPADYEACVLYYPLTNMEAEELLLVKLKDAAQGEAVREAVETRLQTQKDSFEGYGISQFDLLTNHSVCRVSGNYVLFVVNEASDAALQAFLGAL